MWLTAHVTKDTLASFIRQVLADVYLLDLELKHDFLIQRVTNITHLKYVHRLSIYIKPTFCVLHPHQGNQIIKKLENFTKPFQS